MSRMVKTVVDLALVLGCLANCVFAQEPDTPSNPLNPTNGWSSGRSAISALRWLQDNQREDGSWSDKGDPPAMTTGWALLAFISNGHTPGCWDCGTTMEKGLKYLIAAQQPDGTWDAAGSVRATSHAIATWSLCEVYGTTGIVMLRPACDRAVGLILRSKRSSGLWNGEYLVDKGEDDLTTSVWQIQALESARRAGIRTNEPFGVSSEKTAAAFKTAIQANISSKTAAPFALGLQLMGLADDSDCRAGIEALDGIEIKWDSTDCAEPALRLYFIKNALYREGGTGWACLRRAITAVQRKSQQHLIRRDGLTAGWWKSSGSKERDRNAYVTSLCAIMLHSGQPFLSLCAIMPESGLELPLFEHQKEDRLATAAWTNATDLTITVGP